MVHPNHDHGIPLSNKMGGNAKTHNTWMNLKGIMLSERCQTQKATNCIIPLKTVSVENNASVVAKGWEPGERVD